MTEAEFDKYMLDIVNLCRKSSTYDAYAAREPRATRHEARIMNKYSAEDWDKMNKLVKELRGKIF